MLEMDPLPCISSGVPLLIADVAEDFCVILDLLRGGGVIGPGPPCCLRLAARFATDESDEGPALFDKSVCEAAFTTWRRGGGDRGVKGVAGVSALFGN